MNIYEMIFAEGIDYVSAPTLLEAVKTHVSITGIDLDDYNEDDNIRKLPKKEWLLYSNIDDDNGEVTTFAEIMKNKKSNEIISTVGY